MPNDIDHELNHYRNCNHKKGDTSSTGSVNYERSEAKELSASLVGDMKKVKHPMFLNRTVILPFRGMKKTPPAPVREIGKLEDIGKRSCRNKIERKVPL